MPVLLLSDRKCKGHHSVLENNELNTSLLASPTAPLALCHQTHFTFGLLYCTDISPIRKNTQKCRVKLNMT